jgi:hypothetical protein
LKFGFDVVFEQKRTENGTRTRGARVRPAALADPTERRKRLVRA